MRQGFTLIELLVVVAIIGLMIVGAVANLGSGRDAARFREASRGIAQMAHYANALALLRQRPAVLSYSLETDDDGAKALRIDVQLSGETMASQEVGQPAEPIYREVDGTDTAAAGVAAAEDGNLPDDGGGASPGKRSTAEKAGMFFTRQILDPEELAKEDATRTFAGVTFEVELLGEDGAALDDKTAAQVRGDAEALIRNRQSAIRAWSSTHGAIDTAALASDAAEDAKKDGRETGETPVRVVFETNGNCRPHRITLHAEKAAAPDEGVAITVTRSGKVRIGDEDGDEDGKGTRRRRK